MPITEDINQPEQHQIPEGKIRLLTSIISQLQTKGATREEIEATMRSLLDQIYGAATAKKTLALVAETSDPAAAAISDRVATAAAEATTPPESTERSKAEEIITMLASSEDILALSALISGTDPATITTILADRDYQAARKEFEEYLPDKIEEEDKNAIWSLVKEHQINKILIEAKSANEATELTSKLKSYWEAKTNNKLVVKDAIKRSPSPDEKIDHIKNKSPEAIDLEKNYLLNILDPWHFSHNKGEAKKKQKQALASYAIFRLYQKGELENLNISDEKFKEKIKNSSGIPPEIFVLGNIEGKSVTSELEAESNNPTIFKGKVESEIAKICSEITPIINFQRGKIGKDPNTEEYKKTLFGLKFLAEEDLKYLTKMREEDGKMLSRETENREQREALSEKSHSRGKTLNEQRTAYEKLYKDWPTPLGYIYTPTNTDTWESFGTRFSLQQKLSGFAVRIGEIKNEYDGELQSEYFSKTESEFLASIDTTDPKDLKPAIFSSDLGYDASKVKYRIAIIAKNLKAIEDYNEYMEKSWLKRKKKVSEAKERSKKEAQDNLPSASTMLEEALIDYFSKLGFPNEEAKKKVEELFPHDTSELTEAKLINNIQELMEMAKSRNTEKLNGIRKKGRRLATEYRKGEKELNEVLPILPEKHHLNERTLEKMLLDDTMLAFFG